MYINIFTNLLKNKINCFMGCLVVLISLFIHGNTLLAEPYTKQPDPGCEFVILSISCLRKFFAMYQK